MLYIVALYNVRRPTLSSHLPTTWVNVPIFPIGECWPHDILDDRCCFILFFAWYACIRREYVHYMAITSIKAEEEDKVSANLYRDLISNLHTFIFVRQSIVLIRICILDEVPRVHLLCLWYKVELISFDIHPYLESTNANIIQPLIGKLHLDDVESFQKGENLDHPAVAFVHLLTFSFICILLNCLWPCNCFLLASLAWQRVPHNFNFLL